MIERIFNLMQGFLRGFVSKVERDNPEVLLDNERENVRVQMGRFNEGLVSHAALCERLIQQVRKLEAEERDLHARITAHLRAGNRAPAAELALRHQTAVREVEENRLQVQEAETTYKDLVRARDAAVEAARAKIEKLRRGIDEMRIQQAMADLNQMAAGLVTSVGGTGETLSRLEEMIDEQRSRAAGVIRVSKDELSMEQVEVREVEQQALADQALADFAAREGITLPGGGARQAETEADPGLSAPAPEPVAAKSMGPGESES